MKKLLIKVCGLSDPRNIQAISDLDVDMLGYIFYPPSPRSIEGKTSAAEVATLRLGQKKVGVFVNAPLTQMYAIAEEYGLHALQLHGQESPVDCAVLRKKFTILKAFPIAESSDVERTKNYEGSCDYFLFDTKGPAHGGNGVAFDWHMLEAYKGDTPFFLSGGISPEDARKINNLKHPKLAGLDLNSRFETSPGMKDVAAVKQFVNLIM